MLVFTEDPESHLHARSLEGTVQHECQVMPTMDEAYRQVYTILFVYYLCIIAFYS